jgi:transcriptional regulator with XRE-family HTH domain
MISTAQVRAARALLRWRAQDLADASGVGVATIRRMEVLDGVPSGQIRSLAAIQSALEAAGVEFIGTPDDRPGVRLKSLVVPAATIKSLGKS